SVAMIVLADSLADTVFRYGHMGSGDAHLVALALRCYSIGLLGTGIVALTSRFFAARSQMGYATLTNLGALAVNITLSLALVKTRFGFAGIALSSSLTFTIAAVVRLWLLN